MDNNTCSENTEILIRTTDLQKVYRTFEVQTAALMNINLTVKKGEFVAVMGPSGCGKSTLLNILGLLDRPSQGTYTFCGRDSGKFSEKQKAHIRKSTIGFVFQSFNLIDELTIFENIELPLLYLKRPFSERRERVIEMLDFIKLTPRKDHFPQQLSGGQQQRVALARALVSSPRLILADEPTGNLDSSHGNEVMNLLTHFHEHGTTIVMVTHSPAYAAFAQRVIHLFDGHIVTENFNQQRMFVG